MENGKSRLHGGLSDRSGQFNLGRCQCIKGTDETLIHLNLKAMNKTLGIIFEIHFLLRYLKSEYTLDEVVVLD